MDSGDDDERAPAEEAAPAYATVRWHGLPWAPGELTAALARAAGDLARRAADERRPPAPQPEPDEPALRAACLRMGRELAAGLGADRAETAG